MRASLKGVLIWGLAGVVAAASSCSSLPDIDRGICGNGVIEPDHNEDCDDGVTDDAGHPTCYPAGSTAACHFDCSTADCPSGFTCGNDAVCRKPSGIFKDTGHATQIDADQLLVGDFDHDGLGDVVAQTQVQMNVLFGDTSGGLGNPFTVRASASNPTVGLLGLDPDSDGGASEPYSDLVFSASDGVTTWRGRQDRTLAPTPYPSLEIGNEEPRVLVVRTTNATDDVIVFASLDTVFPGQTGSVLAEIGSNEAPNTQAIFAVFPTSDHLPSHLVGDIPVARLIDTPDSPCEQFALAFGAAPANNRVTVITTCVNASELNAFDAAGDAGAPIPPLDILLPAGTVVREGGTGVHFGDFNGDGRLDVVVDALQSATALPDGGVTGIIKNFVAYNIGDGTYSSSFSAFPADNQFADTKLDGTPVLALGQLTSPTDNFVDVVFPTAILLGVPNGPPDADAGPTLNTANPPFIVAPQRWSAADIADIDGDGFPDVVAGAAGRVDLYRGSGNAIEQLTAAHYAVDGTPSELTVGDFDGDRVPDIAFKADHGDASDLDVMWGKLLGMPEDPVVVGRFGNIKSISTGVIAGDLGNNDSVGDLGVLVQSAAGDGGVSFTESVLAGATNRQLQAPFLLQEQRANRTRDIGLPLAFTIGQLTAHDRHPDLVSGAAISRTLDSGLPSGDTNQVIDMQLAVTPTTGAANLGSPSFSDKFDTFNISSTCLGPACNAPIADWQALSIVAVDLDGDEDAGSGNGVDEIVGIAPALSTGDPVHDNSADGALFWARFDGTSWKIQSVVRLGALPSTGTPVSAIAVADVNGDGADDVLVLVDGAKSTTMLAYINQRNGQLPAKPVAISLPAYSSDAGFHIVSFAAIDADNDPGKEVALLTDKGGLFLAKSSTGGDSFVLSNPLCDGAATEACANNPHSRIPSGQAIAAVDVDGDGIQDLILETSSTLHVYKGLAADP